MMQVQLPVAVREFRAKALVAVANRSFTNNHTVSSRVSSKLVEMLLGRSEELDSDFDHS